MKHFEPARLPTALPAILRRTEELGFGMASDTLTGSLLATLAASKPAGRFLELGTGPGISTAWILDGMDAASRLTSVDTDGAVQAVAREAFAADRRVEFILGDALAYLRQQPACAFDFVFADAMPGKYEGLEDALRVLKPGGIYIVDDLLPQPNWPDGHAAKVPLLAEALRGNPDFIATPLDWATGLLIAVRRAG